MSTNPPSFTEILKEIEIPLVFPSKLARPYPAICSFYLDEVSPDTLKWTVESLKLAGIRREEFLVATIPEFMCWVTPDCTAEQMRILCDHACWVAVYDDFLDQPRNTGADLARAKAAMAEVESTVDGSIPDSAQFPSLWASSHFDWYRRWANCDATDDQRRVYAEGLRAYHRGTVLQIKNRESGWEGVTTSEYIRTRRLDSFHGGYFAFAEFSVGRSLPHKVWQLPEFAAVRACAADNVNFINDIGSALKEYYVGDLSNIITVIELNYPYLSFQEALYVGAQLCRESLAKFEECVQKFFKLDLPRKIKTDAERIIDAFRKWVAGYAVWQSICTKYSYFVKDGVKRPLPYNIIDSSHATIDNHLQAIGQKIYREPSLWNPVTMWNC